jgi:hypothetical protein
MGAGCYSWHGLLSAIHVMPDIQLQLVFSFRPNGLIQDRWFGTVQLNNSLHAHVGQKYSIRMSCNWKHGVVDLLTSHALMRQRPLASFEDHIMIYISVSYS